MHMIEVRKEGGEEPPTKDTDKHNETIEADAEKRNGAVTEAGRQHLDAGMLHAGISAPGTQGTRDTTPRQPRRSTAERHSYGEYGSDEKGRAPRERHRSRSRSRGREPTRPKSHSRSRSRSRKKHSGHDDRSHSRDLHHHSHLRRHSVERRRSPARGDGASHQHDGQHGITHRNRNRSRSRSKSRSRSRDARGREKRHRSRSRGRSVSRDRHNHNHSHRLHHRHAKEERRHSESKSRSRSPQQLQHQNQHRLPAIVTTERPSHHSTGKGHHVVTTGGGTFPSHAATPSKRVIHESTLVNLRPSVSPRAFPIEDFELAAEALRSPVTALSPRRRRLSLSPIVFGAAQAKGMRPYMEDRHIIIEDMLPRGSRSGAPVSDDILRSFAAVYDGHNGTLAADHAADRLHFILASEPALRTCTGQAPPAAAHMEDERMAAALVHAFEATDKEILNRCRMENGRGGATGVVVLRVGNTLYAAHCGDSRAVLCRSGEALRLTEDHKPNLPRERKRVEDLGGRVDFARCWRVIVDPGGGRPASGLAVSRSFGDPDFKEPLHLVTATPDVMSERLTEEDSFLVLASDGLWDVLTDTDACEVVRKKLEAEVEAGAGLDGKLAATGAAEALVQAALDNGTMDNITAVVGLLTWV